jgi:uncharacterized membrane protein YdbT with pleckstrin-like domain
VQVQSGEQVLFCGHPSWRSMLAFHLRGLLAAIAAGIAVGMISAAAGGRVSALWVTLAVLAVFGFAIARGLVRRRRITYTISSQRLTIETGLLGRELHETRLQRIQNVNFRQSPLERLLGVGTVDFDTAGGAAYGFAFRGVADPHAIVRMVDRALREPGAERLGATP